MNNKHMYVTSHTLNINTNYWRNNVYLKTKYIIMILSVDFNITAFDGRLVKCGYGSFYL